MRFLQKIEGVKMFDKLRNPTIREFLNIKSLLLRFKRFQLRWSGHTSRMPQERLPIKSYMLKLVRRGRLDDQEQDGVIILKIFVETVWDFVQIKYSPCWWIEKCGGLFWSCCRHNFQKKRVKKRSNNFQSLDSI